MSDSLGQPVSPDPVPGEGVSATASNKSKVKRGCMIGCLLLITIVLMIGGCGYGFLTYMFGKLRPHVAASTKKAFEEAVEGNQVPEADLPLYADLVEISGREETSFYGLVTCAGLVIYDLEDGEVSDEERTDATAARDFLRDNPGVGMARISAFFGDYPRIQEKVERVSRSPKVMPAPGSAP